MELHIAGRKKGEVQGLLFKEITSDLTAICMDAGPPDLFTGTIEAD